ncbi:MAG: fibronectin type III domain-containing protein [Phycisphaerales bacterium]|nr:fibronectin type III domain-containing protein [Phycisphaerales bacterium]
MRTLMIATLTACCACVAQVHAQVAPPTNVKTADAPNDVGNQVIVTWETSPDDVDGGVTSYVVVRSKVDTDESTPIDEGAIGDVPYGVTTFIDENATAGTTYWYGVRATGSAGESAIAQAEESVTPTMEMINAGKIWFLIIMVTISGVVILYVYHAKRGGNISVRKIAGLEAVSEAVGRATEMGREVLFVPGILDINDIQTVAGITVLSNVAKTAAEYDARLEVPTARSLVMTTARETVQAAYLGAGRPDAYDENRIYYLTDEQFGYTAGVQGKMVRDKPAACFYMGAFYAESLILAETGNSIGAIQVAGTAMPSQLPFFVAACDYTLIGEEFFAASAYLSDDPEQLGSLKGQDVGKVIAAGLLVLGCLLATLGAMTGSSGIDAASSYIKDNILGKAGVMPAMVLHIGQEDDTE